MSKAGDAGGARIQRFDAFRLVAHHGRVEGKLDPFDLERVQDALGEENGEVPEAEIVYRIDGDTDPQGRAVLHVVLDGEVPLECQRCLRTFVWPVHQSNTVLLAHDEEELAYLDDHDECEVILAAAPLHAHTLVEDELVLTLPYVPRCERADCLAMDADVRAADPAPAGSPFGALAGLKRGREPGEE